MCEVLKYLHPVSFIASATFTFASDINTICWARPYDSFTDQDIGTFVIVKTARWKVLYTERVSL